MHQVQINDVKRSLPSSWNELTRKQLIMVSRSFNNKLTAVEFKVQLLFRFLRIGNRLWKSIPADEMHGLSISLNYLLEKVSLTNALISSIRIKRFPWVRYYGPSDAMETSTFGEFTKAQVRYEEYDLTHDTAKLDELVAVLFRRKKSFWFIRRHFCESTDPRVRFIDRTLPIRAKKLASLPHELKYSIFLFFSGVYGSLPDKFPHVYRHKSSSANDKSTGWATLIISLADGKTDDESLDRIMNSNLYNVFLGLEQKAIEYFEFIKKYPPND
ncbi:MAG: hypothetical protein Q8M08_17435 [Bacteroidales bacterium]|nr:hypothetical protein [Bacteroidales bacterium]